MDPTVHYYVTTLSTAFKNIAPIVAFLIGGYLVFVKLPFLFLKKSLDEQKKKPQEEMKDYAPSEKKEAIESSKEFGRTLKLMNAPKENSKQKEQRKEKSKIGPEVSKPLSPEEILGFKRNEALTKSELKKRYFELLKQNHPDRVASMGQDFKKLAEKNTKEINRAYDKLKSKAS